MADDIWGVENGRRVALLGHLAKEFEKVHDSQPRLTERLALLENWHVLHPDIHSALPGVLTRLSLVEGWQRDHPDTHRLEGVALGVAKTATDLRLENMNELQKQIESERGCFITRELYDREHRRLLDDITILRSNNDVSSGEKSTLEQFWPFLLAIFMYLLGHFWK
jgi:hypothetical protein